MRVVLDTNVLVSAALNQKSMPGMAALLVERCSGLLKSLAAERQLFEMVARPYFDALIDPDTRAWLMIRRRRDLNAQLAAFFGPCLWSVSALLLVGPSGPVTDRAVVKIATGGRGFSARAMDRPEAAGGGFPARGIGDRSAAAQDARRRAGLSRCHPPCRSES